MIGQKMAPPKREKRKSSKDRKERRMKGKQPARYRRQGSNWGNAVSEFVETCKRAGATGIVAT